MRFFTKELYHEDQMMGRLLFPESDSELDEFRQYYLEQGLDMDQEDRKRFLEDLPYIRQHLPEELVRMLEEHGGVRRVPTPPLRQAAQEWIEGWEKRSQEVGENARHHLASIQERLNEGGRRFAEKIRLHDCRILEVSRPQPDVLRLELDCSGGFMGFTSCSLVFTGVQAAEWERGLEGNWWLYDEVDLGSADGTFQVRALLDTQTGLNELRIEAADVLLENLIKAPQPEGILFMEDPE